MANEQNLIPQAHVLTVEEQSRAGKASGEARRKRKTFKETLNFLMEMPLYDMDLEELKSEDGFINLNGKNIDVGTAINVKLMQRALKGDLRAYELIRDTAGERPKTEARDDEKALEKLDELLGKISIADVAKGGEK